MIGLHSDSGEADTDSLTVHHSYRQDLHDKFFTLFFVRPYYKRLCSNNLPRKTEGYLNDRTTFVPTVIVRSDVVSAISQTIDRCTRKDPCLQQTIY